MYERKHVSEDELDEIFAEGAKLVIANLKLKGIPIALYDIEKKQVYVEYPDGTREYIEDV